MTSTDVQGRDRQPEPGTAIAMHEPTEPERSGASPGGGTSTLPPPAPAPAPAPSAAAAAEQLQAVIPPPLENLVPHQQATPTATTTATTPHRQEVLLPASHTSPAAGHTKEAATALSREDDGGDHPTPPSVGRDTNKLPSPKMIFSDLYKSPKSPFTKLRGSLPQPLPLSPDYDPDLVSKDKTKQKEAVRKFLVEKIRNDWEFTWPPALASVSPVPVVAADGLDVKDPPASAKEDAAQPEGTGLQVTGLQVTADPAANEEEVPKDEGEEADSESGAETDYSVVSEDRVRFRPRADWASDLSDNDEPAPRPSPFRFDTPDAVGTVVQATLLAKRKRRRRALREEVSWNEGLACFEARRNAWTGAKTVRVKPKPPSPASPASPRRLFWRTHSRTESNASSPPANITAPALSSPLSPTTTHASQGTNSTSHSDPDTRSNASSTTKPTPTGTTGQNEAPNTAQYPVEILIPIPPPLLPPQNGMRASVTPGIYPSLYDKIVVHSLQPSCPVNLGDMLRACVVGWKRDGEWPPRPAAMVAPPASTYAALAVRTHRKANSSAAAARLEHARKGSGAPSPSRRMSFGALLGRTEKDKSGEEQARERRDSHHDEDGKGIRKSLQKVFSLGAHGHAAE